jgi:hypothetical protein
MILWLGGLFVVICRCVMVGLLSRGRLAVWLFGLVVWFGFGLVFCAGCCAYLIPCGVSRVRVIKPRLLWIFSGVLQCFSLSSNRLTFSSVVSSLLNFLLLLFFFSIRSSSRVSFAQWVVWRSRPSS